jgi:phosphate:Na+ symporter
MDTLNWTMLSSLAGGLGLFMLGMHQMTEGLKFAAGTTLQSILKRSTSTPFRGLVSGAFITSLVQSSSAVTVAIIGFVNAGLMTVQQAVTVIYGSNIGTTMTGWLVALIGFQFDIDAFALPAIGVGMLLRFAKRGQRVGALGEALAGFGLFFLGIEVLKNSFAGLGGSLDLGSLGGAGFISLLVFLTIGFLLTLFMQSSSAAIAIVLTATVGGVVPFHDAAAVVIGANVGTTSTAAFSVLGATPNARRVAAAHFAFNVITGVVALFLLPVLLTLVSSLSNGLHLQNSPATLLALFHTTFNILGVLLLWPVTTRMVTFLKKRFRSVEEDEARPLYLDRNIVDTPVLAMHALTKELCRVKDIAGRMARGAVSSESGPSERLELDLIILKRLQEAVGDFCNRMQRGNLPAELDEVLPNALRVSGYYRAIAEKSVEIAHIRASSRPLEQAELEEEIAHFKSTLVKLLDSANVSDESFSLEDVSLIHEKLEEEYRELKVHLLRAGTRNEIQVNRMVSQLELISDIRRIAQQAEKGARYLYDLSAVVEGNGEEVVEEE